MPNASASPSSTSCAGASAAARPARPACCSIRRRSARRRGPASILRETEDGFRIAEEDLELRGAGELLGTRQSGLPDFRLVDPAAHGDLLAIAHDDARLLLERDAALATPRGKALRTLLYLFDRDAAVKTLRAV